MKFVIRTLGVILSLSLVFSCNKKSNDGDSGSTGLKLAKVIVWTTQSSVSSIQVYNYRYDAMNRVTEITYAQGDSANGEAQAKLNESIKWFYNGNEQQPYKSTGANESLLHYEEYYTYDGQGRLVVDSTVTANCNCYDVKKYNWGVNKIMRTYSSGNNSGVIFSINQDSMPISDKNHLGIYFHNLQTAEFSGSMYTYDDKTNPLHLLNIHVAAAFNQVGGVPTTGYNENNITETAYGYFDTFYPGPLTYVKSQVISYKYNYNVFNLPVDCEISGDLPNPSKIKFYYTN